MRALSRTAQCVYVPYIVVNPNIPYITYGTEEVLSKDLQLQPLVVYFVSVVCFRYDRNLPDGSGAGVGALHGGYEPELLVDAHSPYYVPP